MKRITLRLWLHREEADAWLVSRSGIGPGMWLPKSQIVVPEGAVGGLNGAVDIELPEWLAIEKGLYDGRDVVGDSQTGLFDA